GGQPIDVGDAGLADQVFHAVVTTSCSDGDPAQEPGRLPIGWRPRAGPRDGRQGGEQRLARTAVPGGGSTRGAGCNQTTLPPARRRLSYGLASPRRGGALLAPLPRSAPPAAPGVNPGHHGAPGRRPPSRRRTHGPRGAWRRTT